MILYKIKTDDFGTILEAGWANPDLRKAGETTEDGFTVFSIEDDEVDKLIPKHSKLVNGRPVVDSDYVPPKPPKLQTNQIEEANAELAKQVAVLTISNANLAKQVGMLLAANAKKEAE